VPSGWRIIGSACSVLVLLVGAGVIGAAAAVQRSDRTVGYEGVRSLRVELGDGRLTVRRGGPVVRVRRQLTWSWFAPRETELRNGSALTLGASCSGPVSPRSELVIAVNCTVDYEIEVPPDLTLTARGDDGIEVDGLAGAVDLTCLDGTIVVTGAGGPVTARTAAGDLDVTFARPPASAELTTDTGDVHLLVPPGHDYRISAAARRTTITVPHAPASAHLLTARGGGTISIGYTGG
jgi:hypothetical protein